MTDTVTIRCGALIDGTGAPPRRDAYLTIADGRVASISDAPPAAGEIIDLGASTVTPGLIDAHVHTSWGYDHQEGWTEARSSAEGIFAWGTRAIQTALGAGVTTVRDCGAPSMVTVRLREAVETGLIAGARVLAGGPCITTTAGHGDFIGVTADTADELRLRVRELCRDGADHIKVMASGGDMDPHTNRRLPQYTLEEMTALVDDAHRLSLPVVAHCNATSAIRIAVAAGVDTIAHCNWLGLEEGTIDYDPEVADRMLEHGTFIDLNVAATLKPYIDGDGHAHRDEGGPRNRWELHATMRRAGANLLFSSDEFGERLGLFPGLLIDAIRDMPISVEEAVHRATDVPARAIGRPDLGVLEAGRTADLAVFDGDLTEDPSGLLRCTRVWKDGRTVARGGFLRPQRQRQDPQQQEETR